MQVEIKYVCYSLDTDGFESDTGAFYQAIDVQQDTLGRLSLTLDTNPIANRVHLYQDNNHNWQAINDRGHSIQISDHNAWVFLKELRATIPPINL